MIWKMFVFFMAILHSTSVTALPSTYSQRRLNGTITPQNTTGWWYDPPNVRGTEDLISCAVTTLALCAWTAYHPNVHPHRGVLRHFGYRVVWMLQAMILPEFVLWCAGQQFWAARRLRNQVNTAMKNSARKHSGTVPQQKVEQWNLKQAFFAVSGGIAVDSSDFWTTKTLTFTPSGVRELAQLDVLPEISETDVEDRSKADALAKILTILQAVWFFAQGIARLIKGLPLTLLEIHVMIHVFCAFAMYGLWFHKPYDVANPNLSDDPRVVNLAALFMVADKQESRCCGIREGQAGEPAWRINYDHIRRTQIHHENFGDENEYELAHIYKMTWNELRGRSGQDASDRAHSSMPLDMGALKANDIKRVHLLRARKAQDHLVSLYAQGRGQIAHSDISTSHADGGHQSHLDALGEALCFDTGLVVAQRSNMWSQYEDKNSKSIIGTDVARHKWHATQLGAFTVLCAMYGGAHLVAWNNHFPTEAEKWMWRASGICMAGFPMTPPVLLVLDKLNDRLMGRSGTRQQMGHSKTRLWLSRLTLGPCALVLVSLFVILGGGYIYGRIFVLVEAFVSLRSPPAGTYDAVAWTSYMPHLG